MNILKCIKLFNPVIRRMKWPSVIGLDAYEFEVEIKFKEYNAVGRGTSLQSSDHALEIAFSEAIERLAAYYNNLYTTNGVAAHTTFNKAAINATKELIERHVFLNGFYNGKLKGHDLSLINTKSFAFFSDKYFDFNVKNYVIGQTNIDGCVVYTNMNIVNLKNESVNGFIVGLGADFKLDVAIQSSEIENLRYLSYLHSPKAKINKRKLLFEDVSTFEDHGKQALCEDYFNLVKSIFLSEYILNSKVDHVTHIQLALPTDFDQFELCVVKAVSANLLPLFVGKPSNTFIDIFKKINNSLPTLMLPHPLA